MSNLKTAFFILGGALKNENGRWRTTEFQGGDHFGVTGDRLRVIAGQYLFEKNPETTLIVSGGRGQYKDLPDAPAIASVLRDELISRGVPDEAIVVEDESGNTYEQLQALKKIVQAGTFAEITIISNRYHLPRIQAMIEELDPELKQEFEEGTISLQSAEEILIAHKPEWKKEIDAAYALPTMQERIAGEEKGIRDLREGKYKIPLR